MASQLLRASDKVYMENLEKIIDMQPGPGAYYDSEKNSAFRKSFDRKRVHQNFDLPAERFPPASQDAVLLPGPGQYNSVLPSDTGYNKHENRKGVYVPFGSNLPRDSDLNTNQQKS